MLKPLLKSVRKKIDLVKHRKMLEDYASIDGWLTKAEAIGLYETAASLPDNAQILEIGSWKGKSTVVIASGLRSGRIYALDPFDASGESGSAEIYAKGKGELPLVEQFKDNLSKRGLLGKIVIKKGYSADFKGQFKNLDFLFIDGDHSVEGCSFDFKTFGGSVKTGGFLAFHDYDAKRADLGPTWTVENLVKAAKDWELVGQYDSLIVFRRV